MDFGIKNFERVLEMSELSLGLKLLFWTFGTIATIALTLWGKWLLERWQGRITVKRIISSGDEDLDSLIPLHKKLFSEEIGDSGDDFRRWLDELEQLRAHGQPMLEEFLLIAKHGDVVCAYLYATYYIDSNYIYISYLGKDPADDKAREGRAAEVLLIHLEKRIRKSYKSCNGLVAELQREDANKYRRRFRQYAANVRLKGYEIPIGYLQPPISPKRDFAPVEEILLFFPRRKLTVIDEGGDQYVQKALVLSILRFIYLQVYADSFTDNLELDYKYRRTLLELYSKYDLELPGFVKILPLDLYPHHTKADLVRRRGSPAKRDAGSKPER